MGQITYHLLVVFRKDGPGLSLLHLGAYSHLLVDPHVTQSVANIAVLGNSQLILACIDKYLIYDRGDYMEWNLSNFQK